MSFACGLDFGTSNSTVGLVRPSGAEPGATRRGGIEMVRLDGEEITTPSAMFYPANGLPATYGRRATALYAEREPGRLLRSLKSILGSSLIDEKTGAGGRYLTFEDILVGFVDHLREHANRTAGGEVDSVVMGRPVHFFDGDADADARAQAKLGTIARRAGFRDVLFQLEPIAAAFDFEQQLTSEEIAFVADIGGGTSDFSIVRLGPERATRPDRTADIIATGGVRVGGTNLDTRLSMATVMPHLGYGSTSIHGRESPVWMFLDLATWHRIPTVSDPKNRETFRQIRYEAADKTLIDRYLEVVREGQGFELARRVEDAKIALSKAETTTIDLSPIALGLTAEAKRAVFNESAADELAKIDTAITTTLQAGALNSDQVTAVFYTGGTSLVPSVRATIARRFPDARMVEGDRFASVGYGLTLDARRRFG